MVEFIARHSLIVEICLVSLLVNLCICLITRVSVFSSQYLFYNAASLIALYAAQDWWVGSSGYRLLIVFIIFAAPSTFKFFINNREEFARLIFDKLLDNFQEIITTAKKTNTTDSPTIDIGVGKVNTKPADNEKDTKL